MARKKTKKQENPSSEAAGTPPLNPANEPTGPPPLDPAKQEEHREAVIATADSRAEAPGSRRDEMRMNMMRSVVTEPLLSRVQAAISAGNAEQ